MRIAIIMILASLLLSQNVKAYVVDNIDPSTGICTPHSGSFSSNNVSGYQFTLDSQMFISLADGQYLAASGSQYIGYTGRTVYWTKTCDNLGAAQTSIAYVSTISDNSAIILVDESAVLKARQATYTDQSNLAALLKTNIQGLYYQIFVGGPGISDSPPSRFTMPTEQSTKLEPYGKYVVDNTFQGLKNADVVTPALSSIPITFYDANDPEGESRGVVITLNIPTVSPNIKMASVCQYTLSDGGSVDFGDQHLSQITDDRNTTVKRSLTLNMDNCYGVNMVKTYITTTATTSDSGLLLNNGVVDGAKNVAVALRVNPSYTESGNAGDNAGKDMYFDSSNPLEWNFGNTWEVTSLSKHIPLDVYLLRTGGEPTPGEYHATATIMMDFI